MAMITDDGDGGPRNANVGQRRDSSSSSPRCLSTCGFSCAAVTFDERAGFDVRIYEGGAFAFVEYDDESVFDLDALEHVSLDPNGAGCYMIVPRVAEWHIRLEDRVIVRPCQR
jgi:hypothetical protein